jgi:capsular polysaccharide transport system ATP-binding protein
MISIRNITKSYRTKSGRHDVFKGLSADFPENANIGILGPNGAGKTTLLRILGGIDHPDSGTIHCNKTISWPLGLRGGFVGNLSGRENCHLVCNLHGLDQRTIQRKLSFIKELSGIGKYFEEPYKYYSSGMGSRVGFALSMAFDFEIILMDEIISVGDREFRDIAKQALDEKRGRSNIIMVSHSMGGIREFCDVGVLLCDGKITVFDDVNEAIGKYQQSSNKQKIVQDNNTREFTTLNEILQLSDKQELIEQLKALSNRLLYIEDVVSNGSNITDYGTLLQCLGNCYFFLGNYPLALKYYHEAVQEKPENSGSWIKLITTAIQIDNNDVAEKALSDFMIYWPQHPNNWKFKGILFAKKGNWAAAVTSYQKGVECSPQDPSLRNQLAEAQLINGDPEKALEHAIISINNDDSRPDSFKILSRILASLKRYDESLHALCTAKDKREQINQYAYGNINVNLRYITKQLLVAESLII